ncbi:hypothetical protein SAMN04488561_6240 [Jiangella alba]|uniref:Uncharacterized protein n=2 Tax=Jiangella alba TaxID=561176 RepID=A0A1H5PWK9_9ACTN|nr:hypothetical protein SAMN04488561_6240 [Jiangella alba]
MRHMTSGGGKPRHADEEIEAAAERFEKWADEVDPTMLRVIDMTKQRTAHDQDPPAETPE